MAAEVEGVVVGDVVEDVDGEVAVERQPCVRPDGVDAAGRAVGDVVEGRVGVEDGEAEAGAVAEVDAGLWGEGDSAAALDLGDGLRAEGRLHVVADVHAVHAVVLPVYHFDAEAVERLGRGVDAPAEGQAHS